LLDQVSGRRTSRFFAFEGRKGTLRSKKKGWTSSGWSSGSERSCRERRRSEGRNGDDDEFDEGSKGRFRREGRNMQRGRQEGDGKVTPGTRKTLSAKTNSISPCFSLPKSASPLCSSPSTAIDRSSAAALSPSTASSFDSSSSNFLPTSGSIRFDQISHQFSVSLLKRLESDSNRTSRVDILRSFFIFDLCSSPSFRTSLVAIESPYRSSSSGSGTSRHCDTINRYPASSSVQSDSFLSIDTFSAPIS